MSNNQKFSEAMGASSMEEVIDYFVLEHNATADSIDAAADSTIPLTIRLNRSDIAQLDHLAEGWRVTRSGLAREMLEEMISMVMRKRYEKKNGQELDEFKKGLLANFDKKKTVVKKGKGKKETK